METYREDYINNFLDKTKNKFDIENVRTFCWWPNTIYNVTECHLNRNIENFSNEYIKLKEEKIFYYFIIYGKVNRIIPENDLNDIEKELPENSIEFVQCSQILYCLINK